MDNFKKTVIDNLKTFKIQLKESSIDFSFDELDKYFYIEDYFSSKDSPYFKKNFISEILIINGKTIKGLLSNLEYYLSASTNTLASASDFEILKDRKDIKKLYFEFHLLHKKYNLIFLKHKENDEKEVLNYFKMSFKLIKDYYNLSVELEEKMLKNMKKKLKEIDEEKKTVISSSIYH